MRVVNPSLASLSQDLSQTINISDAANNMSLELARDMELYEKRFNIYRATLTFEILSDNGKLCVSDHKFVDRSEVGGNIVERDEVLSSRIEDEVKII